MVSGSIPLQIVTSLPSMALSMCIISTTRPLTDATIHEPRFCPDIARRRFAPFLLSCRIIPYRLALCGEPKGRYAAMSLVDIVGTRWMKRFPRGVSTGTANFLLSRPEASRWKVMEIVGDFLPFAWSGMMVRRDNVSRMRMRMGGAYERGGRLEGKRVKELWRCFCLRMEGGGCQCGRGLIETSDL